jgi:Zn-dependent M28 family amino/carboxypeptidase
VRQWRACGAPALFAAVALAACSTGAIPSDRSAASAPATPAAETAQRSGDAAPPANQTAGFDGARAFEYLAKQVSFGPRPAGSPALAKTQDYIKAQLAAYGCKVEEDNFTGQTPIGPLKMKNILAKVPGTGRGIILLLTHYDTLRLENFVGANDAASSTALMLEMARLYCGAKPAKKLADLNLWIAFLDGEEAQVRWTDTDSVYGSRELAARMALAGDLARVKAVILADMIGDRNLNLKREANSTPWLVDLVWGTAKRLGYAQYFPAESQGGVEDDHVPFLRRGVPAVDLIDFESQDSFWHTPQDTLDKVSPRSLAIIGHVLVETLPQIESRRR